MKFKVFSVSSNTNSFGLYGMILVNTLGEAWEVAANSLNVKKKGDEFEITVRLDQPVLPISSALARLGFEIPKRLDPPPDELLQKLFGPDFKPVKV